MWKFVLRELSGAAIGELWNATDRELTLPLNGLATASFTIRNDHPLADRVLNGDLLVAVYDGATLRFQGEIITAEETVDTRQRTIRVNAGGALWRLGHRLCGKSAAGVTFGDPANHVDRGSIASSLITSANAEADTGIRVGAVGLSSNTYIYDPPWRYKPISEAIAELSGTLDGFDFEVEPVEPVSDATGLKIATMNIAAALGIDRPNCAFEYGEGKNNIASFKRAVDRDGLLNLAYNPAPLGSGQTTLSATDTASITARGRHEGTVEGPVVSPQLRQRLVDEHVRVRRFARQIVTFEPALPVYVYGTDFKVGDTVRVRAKVELQGGGGKSQRLNVAVRVYAVTFRIGDSGLADLSIATVNEGLFA